MRQITQCFNANLATLFKQASELKTLTALVQKALAQNEPVPCEVHSFRGGCLVLAVTDPVWAARLRYEIPSLRDQLRKEGLHQLSSIRISLSPGSTPEPFNNKKRTQGPLLSSKAKQAICESAKHCAYPPLRDALERLGEHQASTGTNSGYTSDKG
jgi:hypothetical protein